MSSRLTKFQISITEKGGSSTKVVERDQFTVGRHPDNDIVLAYNQVSRQHLRVSTFEEKVVILDLGSSNGTFVDGKRIPPQHHVEVAPTSTIQVGAGGPMIAIELLVEEKQTNQLETHITAPPVQAKAPSDVPAAIRPGASPQKKHDDIVPEPAMSQMQPSISEKVEKKRSHKHEKREESHSNLKLDIEPVPAAPLLMTAPEAMPQKPPTLQQKEKEFEKIITDARKHANKILHEAEMKADEIAQQAHERLLETEQRADKIFQDRMKEAHIEAEKFSKEARAETLQLLQESRAKAQGIREQAQEASRTLRDQAEKKCQELIALAEKQGHDIKEQRLAEADEIIEQKGVELLRETREQVALEKQTHEERIARERKEHDEKIRKEREAHVTSITSERKTHEDNLGRERKSHLELIDKEKRTHADEMMNELKKHRERIQSLSSEIESIEKQKVTLEGDLRSYKSEIETADGALKALQESVQKQQTVLENLKAEEIARTEQAALEQKKAKEDLQVLAAEIKKQTESRNALTSEFEKLTALVNTLQSDKEQREKEATAQLQSLKARFEEEKARYAKDEEDRANAMKLEAVKAAQKLEKELIDDIIVRKAEMARAILLEIEANCPSLSVHRDWKNLQTELQEHIQHVLSSSKPSLDQNAGSKQTVRKAMNQRRREKIYAGVVGFATCAAVLWGGRYVMNQFKNPAPFQRMVASAVEAQKADLKARRYNPKQTADVKDTYVDSILYTKNFADTYTSPGYQDAWNKAATLYLLKTWRLDEDKSNKVLAMSAALVSQLKEKREAIHPDFVKKGIQQMRDLENESLARMKNEIGGEVRLESFKKFEKKYFEQNRVSN